MRRIALLVPYFRKYRSYLLLGMLFVILNNIAGVMVPPFVRKATDSIVDTQGEGLVNNQELFSFVMWILCFALLKGIFMYFMRQTIVVTSRRIENDLREDMMSMSLQQNQSFFTRYSVGDMMNRMSEDLSQVRTFCGPVIMYLVNTFSMIIMVVAIMIGVSPYLSMWVLFPLPFLALLIFKINSKIYQNSLKIQESLSNMTGINQESFTNAKMIKALNAESWTIDLFGREAHSNKSQNIKLARLKAWYFPLVQFFITLSILLAIYVGSNRVIEGSLSFGNIAEFVLYINMIMFPIGSLGWVFAELERALSSMDRISEVMAYKPDEAQKPKVNFQKNISFREVDYIFEEAHEKSLHHINLDFQQGKKYLLIGRIGAGKSLIISLLLGLRQAQKGNVYVDNQPLDQIDLENYRSKISLVPQEPILFSDTIRNNICFYNTDITEERYEQVLRDCQLYDEIQSFPLGDQTLIGEKGVLLSGGQKQRVSLARALINPQVDLFILDDPFSAVDIENEIKIWDKLKSYFQNKTVIFIANKVSRAVKFDHVVLMEQGEIEAQAEPQKMKEESEFYANMII